jgi:hypothetical protein
MLIIDGDFYHSCQALLFCQNGSHVANSSFGTEFVGKLMAAKPQ